MCRGTGTASPTAKGPPRRVHRLRPEAHRKVTRCALGALAMVVSFRSRCLGGDADAQRFYAHLRYSESLPFTRAHDGFGASLGYNLNRYLSAELSFDHYD